MPTARPRAQFSRSPAHPRAPLVRVHPSFAPSVLAPSGSSCPPLIRANRASIDASHELGSGFLRIVERDGEPLQFVDHSIADYDQVEYVDLRDEDDPRPPHWPGSAPSTAARWT
ncbi:hypothetical protein ABZ511_12480 [Nocardia gamkensis]|uniref:hypothetical protein n=1 Tax=Nocardia gamkensis TaxID=352869 RepID=UPI0033CDD4A1